MKYKYRALVALYQEEETVQPGAYPSTSANFSTTNLIWTGTEF